MKLIKVVYVTIIFYFGLSTQVYAASLETDIQKAFEALSENYLAQHSSITVKKGLAILPFNEQTDSIKQAGLGNTISELISKQIPNSTIFRLIDRTTLNESLKEQKLALSGLVDQNTTIEMGKTAGISIFITGSISELGENYQITIKMIDVETSEVSGVETFIKPTNDLIKDSKRIAFEYISQYGLGINFQSSLAVKIESPRKNYTFSISDIYANYRPKLWLNFKLGVSYLNLSYKEEGTFKTINIQPNAAADIGTNNENISVNPATMEMTSIYTGFDFNWTPSRKINIGFGYSVSGGIPVLEQQFNALLVDTNMETAGSFDSAGVGNIVQRFNPVIINRFEIKPQFFLSPRMTLGLYAAYMLTNHLELDKTTVYDEYSVRPWTGDTPSEYEQKIRDKYYDISPYILGNGYNVEEIAFTGLIVGISFNFYF